MTPAPVVAAVKGLNCPQCGAAVTLRTFEHSLSAVCMQCLSVLDTRDANLRVLHQFDARQRLVLKIPLGTRGEWRGRLYEVVGFQQRTIEAAGIEYSWHEYLLFNPYYGFRYLTEYNGHWNDVRTLRLLPAIGSGAVKPKATVSGIQFTHFSSATAKTTYVLGEFPWQVEVGETVNALDYVAPPFILSGEATAGEIVWSFGEYTSGQEIWKTFNLPGSPPQPAGVFANQPNPWRGKAGGLWRWFGLFLLLTVVGLVFAYAAMGNQDVFRARYQFRPGQTGEASFVTPVFNVAGRPSNVEVEIQTDLANSWAYFGVALINDETGTAYDFGREVSYYFGRDSDGSWTEGSRDDTAVLPSVPPGRYYLRVEPEMERTAAVMNYELRVRRDVPRPFYFWVPALLLLLPPVFYSLRRWSFETQRWQESDYSSAGGGNDDDDEDDDE